jgi:F-type H+-transporting ATPase subunit delta
MNGSTKEIAAMIRHPVSVSYARALYELAEERGELAAVLQEVEYLRRLLIEDRDFRAFVLTPGIDANEKKAAFDRIFSGRLSATLLDFFQVVVVRKSRAGLLEDIIADLLAICDERANRVHVEAVTAAPLASGQADRLSAALAAKLKKTIVLDPRVDAEILGGLVVRYGDWVIDASVRSQLRNLSTLIREHKPGSELVHENQA